MASQTGKPGASQTRHPQGVRYVTPELMPQGIVLTQSIRGAPIYVQFTNPQRPEFGTGTRSASSAPVQVLLPGQGPIDRGY